MHNNYLHPGVLAIFCCIWNPFHSIFWYRWSNIPYTTTGFHPFAWRSSCISWGGHQWPLEASTGALHLLPMLTPSSLSHFHILPVHILYLVLYLISFLPGFIYFHFPFILCPQPVQNDSQSWWHPKHKIQVHDERKRRSLHNSFRWLATPDAPSSPYCITSFTDWAWPHTPLLQGGLNSGALLGHPPRHCIQLLSAEPAFPLWLPEVAEAVAWRTITLKKDWSYSSLESHRSGRWCLMDASKDEDGFLIRPDPPATGIAFSTTIDLLHFLFTSTDIFCILEGSIILTEASKL